MMSDKDNVLLANSKKLTLCLIFDTFNPQAQFLRHESIK
ncbi:hypothetical protein CCAN11_2230022 [Capnocytophaga canimorsus]|uniref:Uncharacterized protein n=1 Tax=Capnocytophaga canimorsus TaxID=28188 RepID=A0A0B7IGF1_9FLAO|nr:hypothetical protein CCAN11_2230022 [Capnocytophaga canimorsus]